jgi:hypothetical protein
MGALAVVRTALNSDEKVEILTAQGLAARLKVKTSWVVDASKPSRYHDQLPIVHIGRHNRYGWGSLSLVTWLKRRG